MKIVFLKDGIELTPEGEAEIQFLQRLGTDWETYEGASREGERSELAATLRKTAALTQLTIKAKDAR